MALNHLTIKKLVDFRKLSERSQLTFANNLKIPIKPKVNEDESGGNYWIRSTSGVSTAFKENDTDVIRERIEALQTDYESNDNRLTRIMYERNLDILYKYEDFDFSIWYPTPSLNFISKTRESLTIKDIPLKIFPHHVFSYGDKESPKVGAILFVTSIDGYELEDLGIFSEAVFKYLTEQHSKKYEVDPKFCLTVNTATLQAATYQQILDGKIKSQFVNTINTLKKYL
jgi:hypothetical protein